MGEIVFPWLNDGEPFQIPSMPLRGHQEVNQVKMERIDVLSTYRKLLFYGQADIILGIYKMLEKHGAEPARKAWQQAIGTWIHPVIAEDMDWGEDDWEENFTAFVNNKVLPQLEVPGIEDGGVDAGNEKANAKLDEIGGDDEARALMMDAMQMDQEVFVKEVWWRLKHKFSKITVPLPDDADEDATPKVLEFNEENLKEFLTFPDDQVKWRMATSSNEEVTDKVKAKLHEDMMSLKTEEELLGNS